MAEYIEAQFVQLAAKQVPLLQDLRASWLLVFLCASPRAQDLLRVLPPAATVAVAADHDAPTQRYLSKLLRLRTLRLTSSADSTRRAAQAVQSQAGPVTSGVFTAMPTALEVVLDAASFRDVPGAGCASSARRRPLQTYCAAAGVRLSARPGLAWSPTRCSGSSTSPMVVPGPF